MIHINIFIQSIYHLKTRHRKISAFPRREWAAIKANLNSLPEEIVLDSSNSGQNLLGAAGIGMNMPMAPFFPPMMAMPMMMMMAAQQAQLQQAVAAGGARGPQDHFSGNARRNNNNGNQNSRNVRSRNS
jgi:hypothetical protein